MPRTFAIGDIHGHSDMLDRLLPQLKAAAIPGETLVFLGDYVDRGPNSKGVVERVLALREGAWDGPVVTLLGNHEDMLLDYVRYEGGGRRLYDCGLWESNGGVEAIRSYLGEDQFDSLMREFRKYDSPEERVFVALHKYGISSLLVWEHLQFFMDCQLHHEDEHAFYVHGGFTPGKPISEQSRQERLWIRDGWIGSKYSWGKPVVYGHTPEEKPSKQIWRPGQQRQFAPLNLPNQLGIDTGSCFGGYLSAVVLSERELFRSR